MLAIAGVVGLVIWAIIEATKGRDVKTGVANSKIKGAAEKVGIPGKLAQIIADAPDSTAAAISIGIPPVAATAIANGVAPTNLRLAPSLTAVIGPKPTDTQRTKWVSMESGKCPSNSYPAVAPNEGWCIMANTTAALPEQSFTS